MVFDLVARIVHGVSLIWVLMAAAWMSSELDVGGGEGVKGG